MGSHSGGAAPSQFLKHQGWTLRPHSACSQGGWGQGRRPQSWSWPLGPAALTCLPCARGAFPRKAVCSLWSRDTELWHKKPRASTGTRAGAAAPKPGQFLTYAPCSLLHATGTETRLTTFQAGVKVKESKQVNGGKGEGGLGRRPLGTEVHTEQP